MRWGDEWPAGPFRAQPRRRNAEGFEIPPDGGRDARRHCRRKNGEGDIDGARWAGGGADGALGGATTGQLGDVASRLVTEMAQYLGKTELK